jgi:hypothetical protein
VAELKRMSGFVYLIGTVELHWKDESRRCRSTDLTDTHQIAKMQYLFAAQGFAENLCYLLIRRLQVRVQFGEFDSGSVSTRFTSFVRNYLPRHDYCIPSRGSHCRHESDPKRTSIHKIVYADRKGGQDVTIDRHSPTTVPPAINHVVFSW